MSICLPDFLDSGAIISLNKDKLLVGWGKPLHLSVDQILSDQPNFYFSDFFFTTPTPWIHYQNWREIDCHTFDNQLSFHSSLSTCDWIIDKPEQFKSAFIHLKQTIDKGHLKKAVPYVFAKSFSQMTKMRLEHCLKLSLRNLNKTNNHLYGYWNNSQGVLGLTPEILFSHSEYAPQKLHTMALAGTSQSSSCEAAFLKNEKEKYEHQLVVEGMNEVLKPLGKVKVGLLQLLKLPIINHLFTPIEVDLKNKFHFENFVKDLHPTPALGAFPLKEGQQWLGDFNAHTPRHYYGSPIGFKYPQQGISKCLVGIRNVQWNPAGLLIGAGSGVVKQSSFEKEWKEIQIKIRAIREQFYL